MAHHEERSTSAIEHVLEILSEQGLGAMAQVMQTLLNEAMKLPRFPYAPAGAVAAFAKLCEGYPLADLQRASIDRAAAERRFPRLHSRG